MMDKFIEQQRRMRWFQEIMRVLATIIGLVMLFFYLWSARNFDAEQGWHPTGPGYAPPGHHFNFAGRIVPDDH